MYCEHCGREMEPGAVSCPACGRRRTGEDVKSQWLGIASLVLALVGFNIAAIVTGLVALFTRRPGRPFAVAGVAVAGLRMVIGVVAMLLALWFGLFVYLAEKADERPARPWTRSETLRREHRRRVEREFEWDEDDTELNVDTSLAGRRRMIVQGVERELIELEEMADDIEESLGDEIDDDRERLIEQAWAAMDSARFAIPDIEESTDDAELRESAAEAHRHLLAVGRTLRELGRR